MSSHVISDLYIYKSLKILLSLVLFVPLLALSGLSFPYTAPKGFLFRVLIEIAAFLYLWLIIKKSSLISSSLFKGGQGGIFKNNLLPFAVLVLFFSALVSAFFGVDFSKSFWGDLDRMIGVWGLLHFVLFFFLLIAVFKNEKDWQTLIKISVGVSVLIGLLAIFQRFFSVSDLLPETERVFSTIGNAGIFGSYLIFNIFFAGYLFARSSNNSFRFLYGGAVFLQLIALFLTGTRGAVLGLVAGVIIFLLVSGIFYLEKEKRKFFLAGLAVVIFAGATLFAFRASPVFQQIPVLARFANISLSDTTAQNRLILWQNSWAAVKAHPVFGWGPENFDLAINKYFDFRLNPYEAWYDRAHNFIFDYGVSGGFIGTMAYLFLIAAIFLTLSKLIRSRPIFTSVFIAMFAAYLVQNFFIFDSFVSFLLFFFALAFVSSRCQVPFKKVPDTLTTYEFSFGKKAILVAAALVLFFSVYSFSVKPILASSLAKKTFDSESISEYNEKLKQLASSKNIYSDEIIYQAAIDYLSKVNSEPQLTQDENSFKILSPALEDLIKKQPGQSNYQTALGWLNLFFSPLEAPPLTGRASRALELAQDAIKISPGKRDPYFISLGAYSVLGDNLKAAEFLNSAKQKLPQDMSADLEKYYASIFN